MQFEGEQAAVTRPVFVDASGRRGRRVRRAFWALGLLMAAYVVTVVLALVGPPGLSRLTLPGLGPVLPGSGAPRLSTGDGRHERVGRVLASPIGSPSPASGASSSATVAPVPTPGRSALPSPSPSPAPGRSPGTTGRPSPAPSPTVTSAPRATPPGQATSRPTPHSTKAAGRRASPSPSPTP